MTSTFRFVPGAITVPVTHDYIAADGSVAQIAFSATFRRLKHRERVEIERLAAENSRILAANQKLTQAKSDAAMSGEEPPAGEPQPMALTTADLLARTLVAWTLTALDGNVAPCTAEGLAEAEEEMEGLGQSIEIAMWMKAWNINLVKAALEKNSKAPSDTSSATALLAAN
ncbi:MAG TPA: hypothetical protein PKD73_06095 [Burkholderiaceae bacterium]|nr:hypothetical protein [Burkholderiaceae bacterium]